jgi:hypothetical protein
MRESIEAPQPKDQWISLPFCIAVARYGAVNLVG